MIGILPYNMLRNYLMKEENFKMDINMSAAIMNKFKDREEAIKHILKKFLIIENNILLSERLFIAKSIINWIFTNSKNQYVIEMYMKDLELFLEGKLDLRWVDGIITKKKESKNDNKKSKEEAKNE